MTALIRSRSGTVHAPPRPGEMDRYNEFVGTRCNTWLVDHEAVPGEPFLVPLEPKEVTCRRCLALLAEDRLAEYWLAHATQAADGMWTLRLENGFPALTISAASARELARRLKG